MAAAPTDSLPIPRWFLVTDSSPSPADLPCTVVKSRSRDLAVWTPGLIETISQPVRDSVAPFFQNDELVFAEDWFPPLA